MEVTGGPFPPVKGEESTVLRSKTVISRDSWGFLLIRRGGPRLDRRDERIDPSSIVRPRGPYGCDGVAGTLKVIVVRVLIEESSKTLFYVRTLVERGRGISRAQNHSGCPLCGIFRREVESPGTGCREKLI